MSLPPELLKYYEKGLILVPMSIINGGKKPLIEYKDYKEKGQDLPTLQGLYETYKDVKPLHWAVFCVNGIVGLDFDTALNYETFFYDIETLTLRSPSGGYHAYIKSLTSIKSFQLLGIEVKVGELCTIFGEGYNLSRVKERTFDLPLLVNPNGRVSRIRLSSGISHSRRRFITSINPPDLVSSSY